ncbi:carbohydrate ABC transporter permease [Rathayibacter sp. VKM Ac-2760]|uniref:carbohydrate ABC transporter permease n=1 Tax=Rathayibacter sp. VKM Ac-2760 TaxID=2609253 RepID=UPI0013190C70|nr:carbohydrate ABC transporter permease [Rathayibacter sp. VKM Ac-2760]QHC61038.1 ABC transporter permease subunit [Rathayibacter sp. VKM Ac-2760]
MALTVATPRRGDARRARRLGKILTTVVLVAASLAIAIPVVWVLVASLKQKGEFYGSPWTLPETAFWQNFADAFIDAEMGRYFLTSILVVALALVLCLVISVPAAYALARFDFRGKAILETLLLGGLFINVNYIVVPIFLMLIGWDRALRGMLPGGFFINNPVMLAVVYAATSIPFTVYLLATYLRTVPTVYQEAAVLDGASRLRIMVSVIIPMALPAINTAILFNFLSFWNDFIISLTLMPGENKTIQVGLLNLFTAQKAAADYGRLYAGMVIVMVPALILYALVQKRLLQGVSTAADK